MMRSDDPPSPARRAALKRLCTAMGAVAIGSSALSASGCAALVDPDAVTEVPLAEIPEGRHMVLHADRRVELRRAGDTVTAFLMVCTHEACDLFWYESEANYRCTCHDGKFQTDGRPKSGPVGKPMFVIPTRVEGDTVVLGPAGELTLS